MEKVARTFLDENFRQLVVQMLPGFDVVKPLSWSGLTRGVTAVWRAGPKGPSIFVLTNYLSDRDSLVPYLAWSSSKALPPDEVEHECYALLRGGTPMHEVLCLQQGLLDAPWIDERLPNVFEPLAVPMPLEWQVRFLDDARVRGYMEAALDRQIKDADLPLEQHGGPYLFSFTLVAGLAPDLMSEQAIGVAYSSIVKQLSEWLVSLQEPLRQLQSNMASA